MNELETLRKTVEKALAFAHAAVDDPTAYRIWEAKTYAAAVLPRLGRLPRRALTLGEADGLVTLVGQLRAVLHVLERDARSPEPQN